MRKFSKISIGAAMILTISAVFAGAVLAAGKPGTPEASPIQNINQLLTILNKIVVLMYRAFFIVAIGFVIWAAFNYLFGGDDPEKIKSATKRIIYAAIAISVALISVGANVIIKNLIGS